MNSIAEMGYEGFMDMFEQHKERTGFSFPRLWDDEVFELIYDFLADADPDWIPDASSIYNDFIVYEPFAFLAEYNYMHPDFVEYMRLSEPERFESVFEAVSEKTIVWRLDSGNYMVYVNF